MRRGICHSHQLDSRRQHRPSLIVHTDWTEWYGTFDECWHCRWVKPKYARLKHLITRRFVKHIEPAEPF